jgi:hypothetical protein
MVSRDCNSFNLIDVYLEAKIDNLALFPSIYMVLYNYIIQYPRYIITNATRPYIN